MRGPMHEATLSILTTHLHHGDGHAGAGGLVLALPGDPGLEASQVAAQGADLQDEGWKRGG